MIVTVSRRLDVAEFIFTNSHVVVQVEFGNDALNDTVEPDLGKYLRDCFTSGSAAAALTAVTSPLRAQRNAAPDSMS